ncbi:Tripeptidyl-peptidase 2 [Smittium mucronatum]|uniref:tripeptidyl-peptidase II n=1 Tax=Smittium mucronatum TaxID=133383 RepID=A0A1R0H8Y6_9FUNG|nr:Tripeptidyl-peptidase 2 [Smittium mucronatum]
MSHTLDTPLPKFPGNGLTPTEDTQASSFIQKYPQFDGRNTVIAILDTGIDPAAAGLKVTSDGKPKIIDIVDCTGSGDVHLSNELEIQSEVSCGESRKFVSIPDGRKLFISSKWEIPSGKLRVGTKMLYDLTPNELTDRIKAERKDAYRKKNLETVHGIREQLSELKKVSDKSEEQKQLEIELNAQLTGLKFLFDNYEDYGPNLDCIVFHDGHDYYAVVNTESGCDLSGLTPIRDYKIDRKYLPLDKSNLFTYSVKIYDNGKLLSIVTTAGSHGTHVAGITAGYSEDDNDMNGVAPGAQLISLKIGDHRLGSLETGAGLTRAANSIIEHKADLANMSYGEPITVANSGFFINILKENVIRQHHCIFVSSAGNAGPGLSTAGAPGGTTEDVIGVGAFVGHQQMVSNYFMLKTVKETSYTWSSLGPTFDGAKGASIYGPGSAAQCYPEYTLKQYEIINGTSMSSPNVCGCLSLLVSGMKYNNIRITPYRVRRAIISTGKDVGDILNVGFIQTENAFKFLLENKNVDDLDISYNISIDSRSGARGIYYRGINECTRLSVEDVTVSPRFLFSPDFENDSPSGKDSREILRREKYDYDRKLVMVSSASWVKIPSSLYCNSVGRSFRLSVDCKSLEEGQLHYAEIQAFDSENVQSGAVFTIPITVAKPRSIGSSAMVHFKKLSFKPTELKRWYFDVPLSASKMVVTVNSLNRSASAPANFVINTCQLINAERHELLEYNQYFRLAQGSYESGEDGVQTAVHNIDVQGGVTIEIVLGQFWSQFDCHDIDVDIQFSGLQIQSSAGISSGIFIDGNVSSTKLDLVSYLRRTDGVAPKITYNTCRKSVTPTKSEIVPLSCDRDILPNRTFVYGMVLNYKVTLAKGSYTFRFPACDNFIYDSWFEDKMIQVFDANKKRLSVFSVYPGATTIKLAGDYYINVLVRYNHVDDLEKIKNSPLFIDSPITAISPVIASTFSGAFVSEKPVSKFAIDKGSMFSIYVGGIKPDALGTAVDSGDLLLGEFSFGSDSIRTFKTQSLAPKKPTSQKTSEKKDAKSGENPNDSKAKMDKEVLDLKISWISKIKDESEKKKLIDELLKADPNNVSCYEKIIDSIDSGIKNGFAFYNISGDSLDVASIAEKYSKVYNYSVKIIEILDKKNLSYELVGELKSNASESEIEARKALVKKKDSVSNAMIRKIRAMLYIYYCKQSMSSERIDSLYSNILVDTPDKLKKLTLPSFSLPEISAEIKEYEKWVGVNKKGDEKSTTPPNLDYTHILAANDVLNKEYGQSLAVANKYLDTATLNESTISDYKSVWEIRVFLLGLLGWDFIQDNYTSNKYFIFPSEFASF